MVENRVISGIQELIQVEAYVRAGVAAKELRRLQDQALHYRNGMLIDATYRNLPELPRGLQDLVAGGATVIIDCAGSLIVHQNGRNGEKK